eukprot:6194861-Pleurochrysis_carterae.AAC.1
MPAAAACVAPRARCRPRCAPPSPPAEGGRRRDERARACGSCAGRRIVRIVARSKRRADAARVGRRSSSSVEEKARGWNRAARLGRASTACKRRRRTRRVLENRTRKVRCRKVQLQKALTQQVGPFGFSQRRAR